MGDVEALLGLRPANRVKADLALRDFIARAGAEHDEALVKLFYRRMLRWCHSIVVQMLQQITSYWWKWSP